MGQPYARYPLLEPSLKNFVDNVLDGRPPAATAEDGRENVKICLAVLESAKTHRPIDIGQPVLS
jgi:predicted dehydrogenase